MGWEAILTAVILVVAAAWAGRALWRAVRPGPTGKPPSCGSCDGCPMSEDKPQQLHDLSSKIADRD